MASTQKVGKITVVPPKVLSLPKSLVFSGLSGAIATTCIYPIDLVKTKLQDQKTVGAARQFRGPLDCAMKIIKADGPLGLYRGWPPNVILVMPEKAMKLTLNDYFRARFANPDGTVPVWGQMAAGGLAGFFQVSATNPMELLKIQGATMADKVASGKMKQSIGYGQLVRHLGVTGLYTGVVATWIRDVPFSVMYFSAYGMVRDEFLRRWPDHYGLTAFAAGTVAGTIAAGLTTPFDVIKTRVHSNAQPARLAGSSSLAVVREFFARERQLVRTNVAKLLEKEGAAALWKGVVPRASIISPLFGITMVCYESFKQWFG
eukprot:TRINITY_DN66325_c6_g2_i2.p1 TRINITY_DN66325_c6_g2~~TRINITY_DN66325_c6_g2_i2.p1  ORF type:complete len:317 (-),score=136.88 TRINITY_DN66325_c6_g2_i2:67-1017(-)